MAPIERHPEQQAPVESPGGNEPDPPEEVDQPPVVPPAPPPSPSYYVSSTGSDGNAGTKASPFLSLNKAYRAAPPGGTVQVLAGIYPAQQTIAYDAGKSASTEPVTFIAEGRAHFEAMEPTSSYWTNIGASHIAFEGDFEFDFINLREDVHGMAEVIFRKTWIHHLSESGNVNGFYLYGNRMGPNNVWPSTGSSQTGTTGPDDILNFGIGKSCAPQACFSYSAKNVNVVGNTFNGAYNSWNGSHSDCIQYTVGQSGYIAGNTFRNCQNETLILLDDLGALANITIENNYLGRPTSASDPYAIQLAPCANCTVRFNSVPASGSLLIALASKQGIPDAPEEKIYGNIAGRYDGGQCTGSQAKGWTWDYNLFIDGSRTCGTNGAAANPLFNNEPILDLDIPLSSPAVDFYRGSEKVPTTDIDGTQRPQGSHPDAGAFEEVG